MGSLQMSKLIIILMSVILLVSAVRVLRPSGRSRAELRLTSDERSQLRMLAMQGQEGRAVRELRAATGLNRRDAKRMLAAIVQADPPSAAPPVS